METAALPSALPVRARLLDAGVCLALVIVVVVTWLPRLQGPLDLRWDAGAYYVLGTSLSEGKGYRLLNEPGEIEMIQYPPGLPVLVAVHQRALRTSDPAVVGWWLRIAYLGIAAAYLMAAFLFLRRYFPLPLAGLAALLCALTPSGSDSLMAEVPFVLLITSFVLILGRPGRAAGWLAGATAVAAFLVRTAGIAVLAVWIAESALRREWRRTAVRLLVASLPVLGWQAYVARVQSDASYSRPAYEYQRAPYLFHNVSYAANLRLRSPYVPELGTATAYEMAGRSLAKLPYLPAALGSVISVNRQTWEMLFARAGLRSVAGRRAPTILAQALLHALGLFVLAGTVVLVRRREFLLVLLMAITVATVCVTPWTGQWSRYLKPVAPLVVLAAVFGGLELFRVMGHVLRMEALRNGRRVATAVAAFLVAVNAMAIAQVQRSQHQRVEYIGVDGAPVRYRLYHYRDSYRTFDVALDWLRERATPNGVVATTMPYWVFLRTGLRAVMPPADTEPETILRLLDGVPVRYLIAGGSTYLVWVPEYVYPAVRAAPDRWQPIYTSPDGELVIYERRSLSEVEDRI